MASGTTVKLRLTYIFDGREYDLLKDNYIHLNDTIRREKQKALKAVAELKSCIAGEKVNQIYLLYWENLKDTEWIYD